MSDAYIRLSFTIADCVSDRTLRLGPPSPFLPHFTLHLLVLDNTMSDSEEEKAGKGVVVLKGAHNFVEAKPPDEVGKQGAGRVPGQSTSEHPLGNAWTYLLID
jgi:hypothetical protein